MVIKKCIRRSILAVPFVISLSCSPLRVAERLLTGGHFTRAANVEYAGASSSKRLDVYRPRVRRGSSPVIIFLYGGRWQGGSKKDYQLLGNALTQHGFLVVVPDYRMYPQAIFPAWVNDAARVVQWTRRNIHRFGGDSSRIWVVGHSSGAHTSIMLALDEHFLRDVGLSGNAVRGFVSIAGPVDTIWTDPDVRALMGPEDSWPSTYPRNHIDGSEAPVLLLHGSADKTVSASNSTQLAARIKALGGCAKAILYSGVGHVEIVVALSEPRLGIAPVLTDLLSFIAETEANKCPYR